MQVIGAAIFEFSLGLPEELFFLGLVDCVGHEFGEFLSITHPDVPQNAIEEVRIVKAGVADGRVDPFFEVSVEITEEDRPENLLLPQGVRLSHVSFQDSS